MELSRIGVMKDKSAYQQQDAHEDVNHLLTCCDTTEQATTKLISTSERITTRMIQSNTYLKYTVLQESSTKVERSHEINLTEDEIRKGLLFSFDKEVHPSYIMLLPTATYNSKGYLDKTLRSLDDSMQEYFKSKLKEENTFWIYSKKDKKSFQVCGKALRSEKMKYAPESLIFRYDRNNYRSGSKLTHNVNTPTFATFPGKYFADGIDREYVLCSTVRHSGSPNSRHYPHCKMVGNLVRK